MASVCGKKGERGPGGDWEEDLFTEEELEVADILTNLPELVLSRTPFHLVRWGARRRRSAEEQRPRLSPPAIGGGAQLHCPAAPEGKAAAAVGACSPNTPLCFSPSDADFSERKRPWKNKTRKIFKKKVGGSGSGSGSSESTSMSEESFKEMKEMVEELTGEREKLQLEISKVKHYYQDLEEANSQLKSETACVQSDSADLNLGQVSTQVKAEAGPVPAPPPPPPPISPAPSAELPLPPAETNPATTTTPIDIGTIHCCSEQPSAQQPNRLESNEHTSRSNHWFTPVGGPLGLPDLNIPAEEVAATASSGFELPFNFAANRAATAAQARKRRIKIYRNKNQGAAKQPRIR